MFAAFYKTKSLFCTKCHPRCVCYLDDYDSLGDINILYIQELLSSWLVQCTQFHEKPFLLKSSSAFHKLDFIGILYVF